MLKLYTDVWGIINFDALHMTLNEKCACLTNP